MGTKIWVARDYVNCSGCRRCEIACSLWHEGKIWPEASRIRVFMFVPGVEIPHLCAQCDDAPCVSSCPVNALSVNEKTGAIIVDREKCTACGSCIDACPGKVPTIHPTAKVCQEGRYNALWVAKKPSSVSYKLYAKVPSDIPTKELARRFYGEVAEELV